MTSKTAYIWGPVSSFSGSLAAYLVQKGWHVHVATKGALHIALSPLDLRSSAQNSLEKAFGSLDTYKTFQDRIKYLDVNESPKGTKYDAVIFCGLPPNFDEARVSRAPWAAEQFSSISRKHKGVPTFIVSSLWGAVQHDGVVPEEIEGERRKPLTQFEGVCQQYENKILKCLEHDDAHWYLVRLPMMAGSTTDGKMINFSGPSVFFEKLVAVTEAPHKEKTKALALNYNPDSTFWFLPVDVAVNLFWRLLEDEQRPRITNLVSTQATLNREWLQDLAKVLGLKKAAPIDGDPYSLPSFLRKSLNDNVLVKTRGLFEVMGRYQQNPTIIDANYFEKILDQGRSANWGKLVASNGKAHELEFSPELASHYFVDFLPENLVGDLLKAATADGINVGFNIEGHNSLGWVLRSESGTPTITTPSDADKPKVQFYFSESGIMRLIQRKVSLERALVQREVRVEGKPLDILRAGNFLKRFLREHPYIVAASGGTEKQLTKSGKR